VSRAIDRKALFIQKLTNAANEKHLVVLIVTAVTTPLYGLELTELLLPITQHMRLDATELGDLADHHEQLAAMGVDIYSVSTDTHFTHKAWHETSPTIGKIGYTMIGDPSGAVTNNFGVMRPGVGLADRATFLVDPDGIIQFVEVTAEGIGRNAAELVRKAKAAQYVRSHPGEVCPAKWEEGAATLAPSLDLVGRI
jgi:peroxiredoxin (alkyl hydroperoxide reductase subunit C)